MHARFFISMLAGFLICGTASSADPSPGKKTQAVSFQIDVAHSGAAQFAKFRTPLKLKWNVDLGERVSYPLIADGKVFVTLGGAVGGNRLVALDQKTGAIVWQTLIGGDDGWNNATYDNGAIFVLNETGALMAFSSDNGKPRWGIELLGQYEFGSPPIAQNGLVYASGVGADGTVYAVNERNGQLSWTQAVSGSLFGAPAFGGDRLYLSFDCDAYALDPASGAVLWKYFYGCYGGGGKTPVYNAELLYAHNLVNPNTVFRADDGTPLGTFKADQPPAFYTNKNGEPMEAVLSQGVLYGIHVDTGHKEWHFQGDLLMDTAPLVINGYVIMGSGYGNLYVVDGTTGNAIWSTSVGVGIYGPDEYNLGRPLTGLGAANDILIVPADTHVLEFVSR